jgi:hypothetical protein
VGQRGGRGGQQGLGLAEVGRVRPPAARVGQQAGRDALLTAGVSEQPAQRAGQPGDVLRAEPVPPALLDRADQPLVVMLSLLAASRQAATLPRRAAGSGSTTA